MKRIIAFILCFAFLLPVHASAESETAPNGTVIYSNEIDCGGGITIVDEVKEYPLERTLGKSATRTNTIKQDGVVIGIITIKANFHYDTITVTVASKSVTQTDTYEGWSYKQNSFTSSGGTVTLDAKLTKLLFLNIPFTMTLSCDKNGNISYG